MVVQTPSTSMTQQSSVHLNSSAAASPPHRPSDLSIVDASLKPAPPSTFTAATLPPSPPTERSATPMAVDDLTTSSFAEFPNEDAMQHVVVSKASDSGIDILASTSESAVELMICDLGKSVSADVIMEDKLVLDHGEAHVEVSVATFDHQRQDCYSGILGGEEQLQSPLEEGASKSIDHDSATSLNDATLLTPQSQAASAPPTSSVADGNTSIVATSYATAPLRAPVPQPELPPVTPITAAEIKLCKAILSSLQRHSTAWPFNAPVDPVTAAAPDYFTIILRPMDISTIQKKLAVGLYLSVSAFVEDIRLMFDNCFLYNPPTNLIHQKGAQLEAYFSTQLARHFPQFPLYHRPGTPLPAPRKVAVPKPAKRRKSMKVKDDGYSGSGSRASAPVAPVVHVPIDTGRPTRERKPKKFYEPEEFPRRSVDESDPFGLKRRRSIGKGSSKKRGHSSDSDSDDEDEKRKTLSNVAKIFESQMQMIAASASSKKSSKKAAMLTGMMTAVMGGLISGVNGDSDSDSNSDSESDSGDDTAAKVASSSSSAPRKKVKRSTGSSTFGRVAPLAAGSVLVDDFDEPSSSIYDTSKKCDYCGTHKSAVWRNGPSGKGSLCNSCGVKARHGKIVLDPIIDPDAAPKKKRKSSVASVSCVMATAPVAAVRVITQEEKLQLSEMIGSLPEKYVKSVVDMIKSGMPGLSETDEIELDMNAIDPVILLRLYEHVKACMEEERRAEEASKEAARREARKVANELKNGVLSDSDSD